MARLYADENFPRKAVIALRCLGHDVVTAYEAGRANKEIPDEEVLSDATRDDRDFWVLEKSRDRGSGARGRGSEKMALAAIRLRTGL